MSISSSDLGNIGWCRTEHFVGSPSLSFHNWLANASSWLTACTERSLYRSRQCTPYMTGAPFRRFQSSRHEPGIKAPDNATGQIASYMGCFPLDPGRWKAVSSVIVARSINESLREAIAVVPNVSLFEYRLRFDFNAIGMAEAALPKEYAATAAGGALFPSAAWR